MSFVRLTRRALVSVLFLLNVFLAADAVAQSDSRANESVATDSANILIEGLRVWNSPQTLRVVLDTSASVRYHSFFLDNPARFVVDIQGGVFNSKLPAIESDNRHLSAIRGGGLRNGATRFVFDLKGKYQAKPFLLSPNELYGHRLVIDLVSLSDPQSSTALVKGAEESSRENSSKPNEGDQVISVVSANSVEGKSQNVEVKPFVVAIDAGHGGEDPGAVGYRRTLEKDLNLSVSRRLERIINRDPTMRAVMIRTGDYYIKLNTRRELARKQGADVFISIHADGFKKRSARGFSVFALSQRGATSTMARALAAKENASDRIGGVDLSDKDQQIKQVLVDLSMTSTINDSLDLGGRVLAEFAKLGKLHSKRVEQAGFAVLKTPDMPSILVETGFITNPQEEARLRKPEYQEQVAAAIHRAIGDYMRSTPYLNQGRYAALKGTGTSSNTSTVKRKTIYHTVKRGDTLSEIAARYGISLSRLKQLNGLRSNVAQLGKRLKVGTRAVSNTNKSRRKASVHKVRSGDSLSKISAKYNVTIAALKRHNGLTSNTVQIGQKIKIPGSSGGSRVSSTPTVYKVRRGDTLSEIAARFRVSQSAISRLNKLRGSSVYIGQRLKIPQ